MPHDRLHSFRTHKDDFFRESDDSPLDPDEQESFSGLEYFPANEALAFELELDEAAEGVDEIIELATSDGEVKHFRRAGLVHFPSNGEIVSLTVFADLERGRLFLPFTDATSGDSTYKNGRYLDPQRKPNGTLVVDFNYAYNPYCAYSEGWSCPIPPAENHLQTPIEAGERGHVRGTS